MGDDDAIASEVEESDFSITQRIDELAVDSVSEKLGGIRQGFVLPNPPFIFAGGEPELWKPPEAAAREDSIVVGSVRESGPTFGVITTQTCDIADKSGKKPWIQIAPVVRLEDGQHINAVRARRIHHLHEVPAIPDGDWVADLRIEIPIEKSYLAAIASDVFDGFEDDALRRSFGLFLARRVTRPAIHDQIVNELLNPFNEALNSLKKSDRTTHDEIVTLVHEFGVHHSPDEINPEEVVIVAITVGELSSSAEEWFTLFTSRQSKQMTGIQFNGFDFEPVDEIVLSDYLDLIPLDLSRLSPEAD